MSDTLHEVEAAIQAHIATHFEGAYVDSWIVISHSQTIDKSTTSNYRIITQKTQPIHVDKGLLEIGAMIIRDAWDDSYDDEDE